MQGAVRTTQDVSTRRNGHALAGCFAGFFIAGPAGELDGAQRDLAGGDGHHPAWSSGELRSDGRGELERFFVAVDH